MPLIASKLANGFKNLVPVKTEAEAISHIVSAWDDYFSGASITGIAINQAVYKPGLAAMQGALVGMSAPNAAAAKIQSAVTAFWSSIAALGPALWALAPRVVVPPLTPPPGLGSIAAGLLGVFSANSQNENATIDSVAQAMANVIHSAGGLGGIAIVQPPPPAPPVPTPIL